MARWNQDGEPVLRATHIGELTLGNLKIPCAVLSDGSRVISQRGFARAMGASTPTAINRRGAGNLPVLLTAANLKPFIDSELEEPATTRWYKGGPGTAGYGIRAESVPKICEVFLRARDAGALKHNQIHLAKSADVLIRGLATVGIIALVDEATGYQYERPRRDLEEYLSKFLSDSVRRWVRTFPASYFKELCRLRGIELRDDMKLPQYFGHLTNNLVFRRLAPGLVKRLKERRMERGSKSNKLHSWLSADFGFPEVLVHLGTVVGVMKLHTNYDEFEKQLNGIAPIYPEIPGLFDDPKDWEER